MAALVPEFRYDCIVVILAHSDFVLDRRNILPMPDTMAIKTILLANPGLECFAGIEDVYNVNDMFEKEGFYGRSPEEILTRLNAVIKLPCSKKPRPGEQDFLRCTGSISKDETRFYNRTYEFNSSVHPDEYGCVLLIYRNSEDKIIIEKQFEADIKTGKFSVTKSDVIDTICEDYNRPLFIELVCSVVDGPPENAIAISQVGIYGGKKKNKTKRKKRKNSYRSRNHKNTQR